jgi:hypothetical protein
VAEDVEEDTENAQRSKHEHRQKAIEPPITVSRHAAASIKERSCLPGERIQKVGRGSKVVTAYPTSRPAKYDGIVNHRHETKKQSEKRMKGPGAIRTTGGGGSMGRGGGKRPVNSDLNSAVELKYGEYVRIGSEYALSQARYYSAMTGFS